MATTKLSSLERKRILIIGDVMLDEFLWCAVDRISPEAPVPVCHVQRVTQMPGGAANVAANIVSLESEAILVGLVGQDIHGVQLITQLKNLGISDANLVSSKTHTTVTKTRIIAHHQHVARVDRELTELPHKLTPSFKKQLKSQIQACDVILISDYLKGFVTPELFQFVIKEAKAIKKPVIADPKSKDPKKYTGTTILTPNFKEFEELAGKEVVGEPVIQLEAKKLCQKMQLQAILITRSEHGMSVIDKTGQKVDIPTQAKDVFDITGAGDTVVATLAVGIANGMSLIHAAQMANSAAGIVVGKVGTATTTPDELFDALSRA